MKAYRIGIDATVTEIDNTGLDSLYAAIGNGCDTVEAVRLIGGNVLYIDEEGLLKHNIMNALATGMVQASRKDSEVKIVGNAVLVGTQGDGEDAEPQPWLVASVRKEGATIHKRLSVMAKAFKFDSPLAMFEHMLAEDAKKAKRATS